MKILLPIVSILIFLYSISNATSASGIGRICRDIEMSLMLQFIKANKDLPTSWSDFPEVGLIKNGSLKRDMFRIEAMNTFTLVPGAPLIRSEMGIPDNYSGHRLFMISSSETDAEASGKGRFVILIKPFELDSKPVRTFSYFIPEETAKIILKQNAQFDVEDQPRAFENIEQIENDERVRKEQFSIESAEAYKAQPFLKDHKSQTVIESSIRPADLRIEDQKNNNSTIAAAKRARRIPWWVIGSSFVLLALALVAWLKLRKSKSTH